MSANKLADLEELRLLTLGHDRDSRLLGNMRAEHMWEAIEYAQAEVERLRAEFAGLGSQYRDTQNKLTNLRVAAERFMVDGDSERIGPWKNLYDAIEASK